MNVYIEVYDLLYKFYGTQSWWPGDSCFEIIIGAILTQNTNWENVEKAIANLKAKNLLSVSAMCKSKDIDLAECIRPSGYFNVKTKRIRNFLKLLVDEYQGNLECMRQEPLSSLRPKLLSVNGIGPETADSILLYAFDKPIFVVDTYTQRVLSRHNFLSGDIDYHSVQTVLQNHLPKDQYLYNEYHALIVRVAKDFCKTKANCEACPLNILFV